MDEKRGRNMGMEEDKKMTDKKIICKEEPPVKVGDNDVSDGTKPVRLWDFLRVIEPSVAWLHIKWYNGGTIYSGRAPEHEVVSQSLWGEAWNAFFSDEDTKRMQVVRISPYTSNYGENLYLDIEVKASEDEEDYL